MTPSRPSSRGLLAVLRDWGFEVPLAMLEVALSMCLGIPSRVVSVEKNILGMTIGEVEASGTVRQARMDYVPGVEIGDYVMVQMGFAVSVISEEEAGDVLDALSQMVDLSSLDRDSLPSGSGAFSPRPSAES